MTPTTAATRTTAVTRTTTDDADDADADGGRRRAPRDPRDSDPGLSGRRCAARRSSRRGWRPRRGSAGCRRSCRSWPRWWSPALRNLDYGDATRSASSRCASRSGTKASTPATAINPERQLDWFLDQAEAVRQQRVAARAARRRPAHYGEWIADVERPAAQYRGRYQLHLARRARCCAGTRPPRRGPRRRRRRRRRRAAPAREALAVAREYTRHAVPRGAARRRRPASTAPVSCSGPTPRPGSRSRG